jgi:hypothetical protein
MSSNIGRAALGAALALALAAGGTPAFASVVAALSLEELTHRSEDVWLARCVGESSRYDDRGRIVTDLTLSLDDSMKGRHRRGEETVITVLGGVVGDVGMQVPGEARMAVGDEALVFVRTARDGRRHAVGLSQGVLPVRRDSGRPMVHPGSSGLHLVRGTPGARMDPAQGALTGPVPLDEMVSRVRTIVDDQAGSRP